MWAPNTCYCSILQHPCIEHAVAVQFQSESAASQNVCWTVKKVSKQTWNNRALKLLSSYGIYNVKFLLQHLFYLTVQWDFLTLTFFFHLLQCSDNTHISFVGPYKIFYFHMLSKSLVLHVDHGRISLAPRVMIPLLLACLVLSFLLALGK